MKKLIIASILLVSSSFAWSIEEGYKMPDFPVIALNGKDGNLTDHMEGSKLTYVEFWATWCSTCKKSFSFLNEMQEKYGEEGLNVVAVSLDEAEERTDKATKKTIKDIEGVGSLIKEHLDETPANFTVLYGDSTVTAAATQVESVPVAALVDASGKVVAIHKGFKKKKVPALEKEIVDLLAKQPKALAQN